MSPNHSKHAVLEGIIDSFCLVCETYLKCEREKEIHILQESHIQNLNAILHVEEFKNDGIRKIKKKYFCELCNRLLPVLARVRLHVNDSRHIHKKIMSSIKRVDNFVVAFEEIVISEQSWQGFCENFCAVCNIDYEDEMKHKVESTHILNLIQIKLTIDEEKNLYREVDEELCHCLTCNKVIASNMITSHFSELEHKNKLQVCRNDIQIISNLLEHKKANKQKKVVTCKDVSLTVELLDSDSKMLTKNEPSESIDMEEKGTETSREMKDAVLVKPINMIDETHENENDVSICIDNKVNNICSEYIYDKKSEERIIQVLNCTEYVTLDENGKTWCILCGWIIDAENFFGHIVGEHHTIILNMHKKRLRKLKKSNLIDQNLIKKQTEHCTNSENNQIKKNGNTKTIDLNGTTQEKKNNKPLKYKTKTVNAEEGGKDSIVDINYERSNENTQSKITKDKDTTSIIELVPKFESSGININLELNSAVCRKCAVSIDFKLDAIENHIVEHNKKLMKKKINSVSFSAGEDKIVNRKYSLFTSPVRLKQDDSSEECKRTDSEIEESEQDTKAILKTDNEKENPQSKEVQIVKPQLKNTTLQKIQCKEFIKEMFIMTNNILKDVIINENLCINFFSLVFVLPSEGMMQCLYCKMAVQDLNDHITSVNHAIAMEQSWVITNYDSEFIREIYLDRYHCGYCNIVVSLWDEMEKHLESSSHEETKKSASWRFQSYRPLMFNNIYERHLEERVFANLFTHFF